MDDVFALIGQVWSDHMLPRVKSFARTIMQTASMRSSAVQFARIATSHGELLKLVSRSRNRRHIALRRRDDADNAL
jgi:hypothetical protein